MTRRSRFWLWQLPALVLALSLCLQAVILAGHKVDHLEAARPAALTPCDGAHGSHCGHLSSHAQDGQDTEQHLVDLCLVCAGLESTAVLFATACSGCGRTVDKNPQTLTESWPPAQASSRLGLARAPPRAG